MSVKILLGRRFKEALGQKNFQALEEIRMRAMEQEGYITGETLVNFADSREVLVVSTWSSLNDWKRWADSEERRELENELMHYLEGPTDIRHFMLGADALKEAFERFVHESEVAS